MMKVEPQAEHRWLEQLVGEWTFEAEAAMGPDKPSEKSTGRERVRSLGGLWILAEGEGEMPGGGVGRTLMTLGYDPQKQRYVGTWVGSMMTWMFIYEGAVDAGGKVLALDTEGPDFGTPGKTARYRDSIEVIGPDRRVLRSQMLGEDGRWNEFMAAHYRRVK